MTRLKKDFLIGGLLIIGLFLIWPWFQNGYPANSASFEPAVIAQARFISQNWPHLGWYPNWYLGLSFRFLGSPLLPFLMAGLKVLLPGLSLWLIYRLITGVALLFMPVGIYCLVRGLVKKDQEGKTAFLAALIFMLLPSLLFLFPQVIKIGLQNGFWPWQMIGLTFLGNGTKICGLALLPFVLLTIDRFLKGRLKGPFWPVFLIALLALTDLSVLSSLLILVILLLVTAAMVGKLGKKGKLSLKIGAYGLALVAFYYTPRFWWQMLSAPSLAGKRVFSVILFLGRILSIGVPMLLGIVTSRALKKKKDRLFLMSFLWVVVFGLLSLSRFLADTDFWQDYTSWGVELGMGVAIFLAWQLARLRVKKSKLVLAVVLVLLSSLLWLGKRNKLLAPRLDISRTIESRVAFWLEDNTASGERVFLSGSPVFWLNSLVNVAQVRGGADKGATHPFWDHAAYQIREGEDPELAAAWLKALGVSWLVVHDLDSTEPYHDFSYPEKFVDEQAFQPALVGENDTIYKVKAGLARQVSNSEAFLSLEPPQDGADGQALKQYNRFLDSLIPFRWLDNQELIVQPSSPDKAISLAATYDSGWQARQGSDKLIIKKDSLGQMVILPKNGQEIRMKFQPVNWEQILGFWLSIAAFIKLLRLVMRA